MSIRQSRLERENLEAHVDLCAERYRVLEEKFTNLEDRVNDSNKRIEEKIDNNNERLEKKIDQISNDMSEMVDRNRDRIQGLSLPKCLIEIVAELRECRCPNG